MVLYYSKKGVIKTEVDKIKARRRKRLKTVQRWPFGPPNKYTHTTCEFRTSAM